MGGAGGAEWVARELGSVGGAERVPRGLGGAKRVPRDWAAPSGWRGDWLESVARSEWYGGLVLRAEPVTQSGW